ncbi:MAG TPA: PEP/pyruvate-binding domain-containing protein [bacterium]|nr:PEP/pyruvate-binding domain-containing protein [bacterium]
MSLNNLQILLDEWTSRILYSRARIIPLEVAVHIDLKIIGRKAKSISALMQMKRRVAPGFIVNGRVFNELIVKNKAEELLGRCAYDSTLCEKVRQKVSEYTIPRSLIDSICRRVNMLKCEKIIIRSSFPGEDGKHHSMAGVFASVVTNTDRDQLEKALLEIWLSYFSEKATAARDRVGDPELAAYLPVIIQKYEQNDVSLLCSSANPVSGVLEEMLFEISNHDDEKVLIVTYNKLTNSFYSADDKWNSIVEEDLLRAVKTTLLELELKERQPVQMEACIHCGDIMYFQYRTHNALGLRETFINSYVAELISVPLTPLSRSLLQFPNSIKELFEKKLTAAGMKPGTEFTREFKGRLYLHYNAIYECLNPTLARREGMSLEGIKRWMLFSTNVFMTAFTKRKIHSIANRLSSVEKMAVADIRDGIISKLLQTQFDLFYLSDSLAREIRYIISIAIKDKSKVENLMRKLIVPPEDTPYRKMMKAAGELDPCNEIDVMHFAREFGHWGNLEFEVYSDRIADNPLSWLPGEMSLKKEVFQEISSDGICRTVCDEMRRDRSGVPVVLLELVFKYYFKQLKNILSLREFIRDRLNHTLYEIGKKVAAGRHDENSFFMSVEELEKESLPEQVITDRKNEYFDNLDANVPPVIHVPEVVVSLFNDLEEFMPGIGTGNRVVYGKACVEKGPPPNMDSEKYILIIKRPSGEYGIHLKTISGIIIENGGPLAHLVQLSSEANIPAITGVAGATTKIKDGDTVMLDSGKGLVKIVT